MLMNLHILLAYNTNQIFKQHGHGACLRLSYTCFRYKRRRWFYVSYNEDDYNNEVSTFYFPIFISLVITF